MIHIKNMHRKIIETLLNRKLDRYEVVHHIDENKQNNKLSNLMLMTLSEHSSYHQKKIMTTKEARRRGIKGIRSTLTPTDIREIKKLLKKKNTCKTIAKIYNVNRHNISDINVGKRWAHIK